MTSARGEGWVSKLLATFDDWGEGKGGLHLLEISFTECFASNSLFCKKKKKNILHKLQLLSWQ